MNLAEKGVLAVGVFAILLAGLLMLCGSSRPQPIPAHPVLGRQVFGQNCAVCHGAAGEGKDPAPPLNSLGHADHHPDWELYMFVADGKVGFGQMPAWKGRLSDLEIRSVIAYLKTLWTADQRVSQQHITEIRPAPPGP